MNPDSHCQHIGDHSEDLWPVLYGIYHVLLAGVSVDVDISICIDFCAGTEINLHASAGVCLLLCVQDCVNLWSACCFQRFIAGVDKTHTTIC